MPPCACLLDAHPPGTRKRAHSWSVCSWSVCGCEECCDSQGDCQHLQMVSWAQGATNSTLPGVGLMRLLLLLRGLGLDGLGLDGASSAAVTGTASSLGVGLDRDLGLSMLMSQTMGIFVGLVGLLAATGTGASSIFCTATAMTCLDMASQASLPCAARRRFFFLMV